MNNVIKYKFEIPTIDDYYPLYLETEWNEILKLDKNEVHKALEGSFFCVCAYDNDKLVGFARANSDGVIYCCLYDVIVKPCYQNQGIGSVVVNMIIDHCKSLHIRSIHLFSASGKKGFYEKLGFEVRPDDTPGMKYIGNENR